VIGFNLAAVKAGDLDLPVLGRILAVRQASAIVLVAIVLAAEAAFVGVLGTQERTLVGLIALFPIAANVSLFASLLGTREKDAAILVALSSLLSLILVTLAVAAMGAFGVG
jgi:predicted permease